MQDARSCLQAANSITQWVTPDSRQLKVRGIDAALRLQREHRCRLRAAIQNVGCYGRGGTPVLNTSRTNASSSCWSRHASFLQSRDKSRRAGLDGSPACPRLPNVTPSAVSARADDSSTYIVSKHTSLQVQLPAVLSQKCVATGSAAMPRDHTIGYFRSLPQPSLDRSLIQAMTVRSQNALSSAKCSSSASTQHKRWRNSHW